MGIWTPNLYKYPDRAVVEWWWYCGDCGVGNTFMAGSCREDGRSAGGGRIGTNEEEEEEDIITLDDGGIEECVDVWDVRDGDAVASNTSGGRRCDPCLLLLLRLLLFVGIRECMEG